MARRRRLRRWLVVGVLGSLVALALAMGYRTESQAPVDVVAATRARLGIDLESDLVEINGVRLHVVRAGPKHGAPVVLLHGFPEFWWAWNVQIARLARAGFRVIAPDQRGYNASDKPPAIRDYSLENLEADVLGLLDELGLEDAYLAGHDLGGRVAWHLAIEHPERVRKLVIFNAPHPLAREGAAKSDHDTIRWYRTFFLVPWLPELVARYGNWAPLVRSLRSTSEDGAFSETEIAYYRDAWAQEGAIGAMIDWYRAGFWHSHELPGDGRVGVPTQIVWGMRDAYLEPALARRSAEFCSEGNLTVLPDAGHWLLHEEPELTSQLLRDFFRGR